MGELGQRLKQARETQGVSLDAIAQQTRIGVRLLKAIEEEDFDRLPGGIFNKSFIQQYAQCLGLDEKQAVRDYLRATAASREAQNLPAPPAPKPSNPNTTKAFLRFALGFAAIALIAFMAWMLTPRTDTPQQSEIAEGTPPAAAFPDDSSPAQSADTAAAAPPEADLREAPGSSVPGDGPELRQGVQAASAAAPPRRESAALATAAELLQQSSDVERLEGELPEELLLEINARSTVWISITADGERAWQGTLQPNQSREVQALETIRLTVGNAGGVELTLNGKELGSLGGEGEVKTVTLAARALQEVIP
jgi:cytoskeletal protein RodZ